MILWVSQGGPYSLVPNKIFLMFPCSLKVFLRLWCSLFPKICFCSRVPSFIFVLFPCPQKVNGHVPLFPETPGGASGLLLACSLDSDDGFRSSCRKLSQVTNISPVKNYPHPDDHTILLTDTPRGFKPFAA